MSGQTFTLEQFKTIWKNCDNTLNYLFPIKESKIKQDGESETKTNEEKQ